MALDASTLLIVDDDGAHRESLAKIFEREGYNVLQADSSRSALEQLRGNWVHVVLTDLMMPGPDGVDLLKAIQHSSPQSVTILMTAYGTVETAVRAMKEGAYDFIEKPLRRAAILRAVERASERAALSRENIKLRAELQALKTRDIVGRSSALMSVLKMVDHVAPLQTTVLVSGETGTGKELIARRIHDLSPRAAGPFVAVNCGALPEGILEAELFGVEKGAFTGAHMKRDGRFARARGGTIFLDEIGELAGSVQVKLLRVLQEGEFEPLGGQSQRTDARVIAATNRDLATEVEAGRFREDLYYRLNVIELVSPPLRSRPEDIPLLVSHFLLRFASRNQRAPLYCGASALQALTGYSWPGNVRELENVLERASVLCTGEEIKVADLPAAITQRSPSPQRALVVPIGSTMAEVEVQMIRETLNFTGGDKVLAAQLLGISQRTIYRRLGEQRPDQEGQRTDAEGTS